MPGSVAGFTQSPCSRHTTFMRVSLRLHASAAPDAPAPMMRTSAVVSGIALLLQGVASSAFATPPARHDAVGSFSASFLLGYCSAMGRPVTAGGRDHRRPPDGHELGRRELLVRAGRAAVATFAGGPLLLATARVRLARAGPPSDPPRRAGAAAGGTVLPPGDPGFALAPPAFHLPTHPIPHPI